MTRPTLPIALLLLAAATPVRVLAAPRQPRPGHQKMDPRVRALLEREATRRFRRGIAAYRTGDYEGALRLFLAASELVYRPAQSYNIALCYEKIGQPDKAVIHLRRYLRTKPSSLMRQRARDRLRHLMDIVTVPVKVTSFPAGAALYVDGRGKGLRGRTPFTIRLRPGPHRLEVRAEGFVPASRRIRVVVGGRNYHDFQLRRQSSLRISASVAGARVVLDGRDPAKAPLAPLNQVVSPGKHRIQVLRPGYYPVTRHVDVRPGDQVSLFVDLRPMPRYGTLQVVSNVAGATVYLEQEEVGETPLRSHRLRVGTFKVVVRKRGYQPWTHRVSISHNQLTQVRVHLSRVTSRRQIGWLVSGAVVTGLLLTGGMVMTLTASNALSEYQTLPTAQLRRNGRTYALTADILYATAVIFGAVTAFVTWRLRPPPSKATITPVVGPGYAGVSYGGRF